MSDKINYKHIESVLKSKATQELQDAVAQEIEIPDRPLDIHELESLAARNTDMTGVSWTPPDVDPEAQRQQLGDELDEFDALYGDSE